MQGTALREANRVEAEANQRRIRGESEANQTHRSCHAPPKQRREIPRAHRDAPYKDVGRAHLWGSKAAVVSVCMQGRWSPRRSTPAARAPPTHPHTTARAMQERAARPPRTCGEEEGGRRGELVHAFDTRKGSTPSYIWRCSSAELERTFTGQLRSVVRDAEVASAAAVASLTLAQVYRAGKLTWLREAR